MTDRYYFDNAATTPISAHALDAYAETARIYRGNPSALHREGTAAHDRLEMCRKQIASLLAVPPVSVTFTSGATEANGIVVSSLLWARQPGQVIFAGIEHPSVLGYTALLRQCGWTVTVLDAPDGFVSPGTLEKALTEKTRLVCCQMVNNVVGTVQDIGALTAVVRSFERSVGRHIHFHTDAVQALGKIRFSLSDLGVDSASFSAHKFNGPRGIGILYNTDGSLRALSAGGHQERGIRPGTENLAAIASMTVALSDAYEAFETHNRHAEELWDLAFGLLSPDLPVLSVRDEGSPYIFGLAVPSLPSEVCTRMLYDRGFCVSSGSACSNNARKSGDGVLASMHVAKELRDSAVRISFGFDTPAEEVKDLASAILSLNRNGR